MSLFRTLDRTSAVSNPSTRPIPTFLCPVLLSNTVRRSFRATPVVPRSRTSSSPLSNQMDSLFIQALARAASCHEHAKQISTLRQVIPPVTSYRKTRRNDISHSERRGFKMRRWQPFKQLQRFAQSELKALVDYYGIKFEPEQDAPEIDDGPFVWKVGDDHKPFPVQEEIHKEYIEQLSTMLQDEKAPHEELFHMYKRLPAPGVVYLTTETIHDLLHHLSVVERADRLSMQRFLSILDDMKSANIRIKRSEWTSAIYFAGRFMPTVSADELTSALHLWRDMESRAGVAGGIVTLNVLFDIAVKAGKYPLAEMFLKELETRKLKLHRHFRVSLLYFWGVRQDGERVRQTYQELVSAGDIVDTVVLNAVIASLIRAGEPTAAEHVFERMKRLHAAKKHRPPAPKDWRERRKQDLDLTWEAQKADQTRRQELQDIASILPDVRTYGLLIRHHASTAGNIDRVNELLSEMQRSAIPIDGTIYIVVIYGFSTFGGLRYSAWTREKLEDVWSAYLGAVRDGAHRTWLSSKAVIAALRAFRKCADVERMLRAWEEVQRVWEPDGEEREHVMRVLRSLVLPQPSGRFFYL
ncbi:hypothetical protein EJ04DRAFT_489865 [Polyplosphaeria fusca]|uniref:Pentatricopeptide repeat-containing protein n=1 Tax=Polyplosphaeria fusca TaxID=682080 RepID=A0A9P4R4M6_9PLEO|nr:hypothetical protein EJ04DRAFT_489865 [Polyplosphaeria fusca]